MQNFDNLEKDIKNFSYIIDKDFLVWPENSLLKPKNIELIEKWGLKKALKMQKTFFNESAMQEAKKLINVEYDKESIASYHILISNLEEVYETCKKNKKIYYQDVLPTVKKVIEFYKKNQKTFIKYIKIPKLLSDYNTIHPVNTAILTVALGSEMNLNNHKMVELCTAALLHKIGFLFIPLKISEKKEKLSDEEFEVIKKYPTLGHKILSTTNFSQSICSTILTHKENLDGSGYPNKLKSENINIESNVIGAASAYSAILLDRTYKEALNSGASLIELIQDADKKFDKRVLKLIIKVLSQCPLDFIVELNDKSIAKIIKINETNTNTPYIQYIIKDNKVVTCSKNQNYVKSIPKTETGIKKILRKDEIEFLLKKYSLEKM
ncbi:Cyclic di-GMP phosphodiesterase PdeB [Borrelia miyamotoi]|uniref:HD-GYP domain-containing protein n=1 Tax=Borrelia miyamotoi TaxID=47466 RepID=A0AAP9CFT3_9SPIR|nr:HD-GYP domain-containing protein [Borrelia miyamotoi]AHH05042.1 Sensory transduction protein [Borrelia miyamotoi FR64b]ATQ14840.1 HD-GYP domain-containing protein [Borrelia miyamotoi]ATQ16022.1 HD-GYP domain-containing protein [Borrelia miyamotoi]ATQ17168.1 HD-GYP domain-containing protein [Borrelia miyamotoi]ATQ18326.1 HD-GYP domain-containing protein [Borrelia miyamotoi]